MKKILVVEDEIALQKIYKDQLGKAGFGVDIALDGRMALEKLKTDPVDLVILDIRIPGQDGLSVLSAIKSKPGFDMPVIVVSNLSSPELMEGAKKMGAMEYLVKINLSMVDLIDRIKRILSS